MEQSEKAIIINEGYIPKRTFFNKEQKYTTYNPSTTHPFKTPFNSIPEAGEIKPAITQSNTIPNDTMSIREILDRHTRGIPANVSVKVPIYNDEDTMPDYRSLDLTEIQAIREEYLELKETIEARKKESSDKKRQQEIDELVEKKIQELQNLRDNEEINRDQQGNRV